MDRRPAEDVDVVVDEHVAVVEVRRGPHNYFDPDLLRRLADVYATLDTDPSCRAIVLCSEGRNFGAGMDLSGDDDGDLRALYGEALRLFEVSTPVVAAVQGAAVGGGLGLACSADLRVASRDSRFSANFARLGLHHGFGLSVTLPSLVGPARAGEMLYTGRAVRGEEAGTIGLCDRVVGPESVRAEAVRLAADVATSAPLAVQALHATLRTDLVEAVRQALPRERKRQLELARTDDFREGVRAASERRAPVFSGS